MMYYFIKKQRFLNNLYTQYVLLIQVKATQEFSKGFVCVMCCDNLYSLWPLFFSQQQTFFTFKWFLSSSVILCISEESNWHPWRKRCKAWWNLLNKLATILLISQLPHLIHRLVNSCQHWIKEQQLAQYLVAVTENLSRENNIFK